MPQKNFSQDKCEREKLKIGLQMRSTRLKNLNSNGLQMRSTRFRKNFEKKWYNI